MQGMIIEEQEPHIVAVSGGVDSVVLLDMLMTQRVPLIVAHVNHGIRSDSDEDEIFVKQLAAEYGVTCVSTRLALGPHASEETARHARYAWLELMRAEQGACAIVTAHHEDDVLETICINLTRGTGWRGLCSLRETTARKRPLLGWSKVQIINYAIEHDLAWREDSTNESLRYLRNRIRNMVIPRLSAAERQKLRDLYDSQLILRTSIDTEAKRLCDLYCEDSRLSRHALIMSSDAVGIELLRTWLGESLEQARLRDLLLFAKTARNGAKWSLDKRRFVQATSNRLIVLTSSD